MTNGAGPGQWPEVLITLRTGHPRLFLTPQTLERLRADVKTDPGLHWPHGVHTALAKALLVEAPVEFKIVGPRMLEHCQVCRRRIATLAMAHLLTGEEKYAVRAVREMEAAAALADWNPSHFLDAAELACALGTGYDWLYNYMTVEQRVTVRKALIEKGLKPGLACYRGIEKYGWWTKSAGNWNVVCSGGLAVGALAVADEEPALAAEIIDSGLAAVRPALDDFGPDGSWRDGPKYWAYTMEFVALYLDALRTALGSMKGLEQARGLAEAGMFRIASIGPFGDNIFGDDNFAPVDHRIFNFGDADEEAGFSPATVWLGRTFNCPLYTAEEWKRAEGGDAMGMVWNRPDPEALSPLAKDLALDKVTAVDRCSYFRRDEIGFFRSAWNAPRALWLAFKGGDAASSHSHLDCGSFVLEADEQRWAIDLGPDDYDLPGYFGDKRWTYYRLGTASHSTLLINGENQLPPARAPIVAFQWDDAEARAVIDLSACYPAARSVRRGLAMIGGSAVLVQDEVEAPESVTVLWGMMTRAAVSASGADMVLEQEGRRLRGRILEPGGAVFDTVSADAPPPQAQQVDVRKLVVRLPQKVTSLRLVVALWPDRGARPRRSAPSSRWPSGRGGSRSEPERRRRTRCGKRPK